MFRDTRINVALESLITASNKLSFSAGQLSMANVRELDDETETLRRLNNEVTKVIKKISQQRPE